MGIRIVILAFTFGLLCVLFSYLPIKHEDKTDNKAVAKAQATTVKQTETETKKGYTLPANPKIVIFGECFVEDLKKYCKKQLPKNTSFVYKIGISTYGLMNTNFVNYEGMTITALERVAYYKPDRVYMWVGLNETEDKNPKKAIKNVNEMHTLLKKINPNIEFVIMALPPLARDDLSGFGTNATIKKYNKAYKKYAKKNFNVFYYNDYLPLVTNEYGTLKSSVDAGDGAHWKVEAAKKVAKNLKKHSDKLNERE